MISVGTVTHQNIAACVIRFDLTTEYKRLHANPNRLISQVRKRLDSRRIQGRFRFDAGGLVRLVKFDESTKADVQLTETQIVFLTSSPP